MDDCMTWFDVEEWRLDMEDTPPLDDLLPFDEARSMRERFHMPRHVAATLAEVGLSTVWRYETGRTRRPRNLVSSEPFKRLQAVMLARDVDACNRLLSAIFASAK